MTSEFEYFVKENRRLKNQIREMIADEKSVSFTRVFAILLIGFVIGYSVRYVQTNKKITALSEQYRMYFENIIDTPEYKAVEKCKDETVWFGECVNWELKEKRSGQI